jgi:hypothetical protein
MKEELNQKISTKKNKNSMNENYLKNIFSRPISFSLSDSFTKNENLIKIIAWSSPQKRGLKSLCLLFGLDWIQQPEAKAQHQSQNGDFFRILKKVVYLVSSS